ncbi:hypothetical protein CCH79_00009617 [Gambusia affinis]|uniref:Uncharacterized protein n=1 Tax=Gambusia affinis TaxID=33528 RepID=A0A315W333_GAMAF|nr:hypothetical protein CCH79_00009617 [Gambusia affinis]
MEIEESRKNVYIHLHAADLQSVAVETTNESLEEGLSAVNHPPTCAAPTYSPMTVIGCRFKNIRLSFSSNHKIPGMSLELSSAHPTGQQKFTQRATNGPRGRILSTSAFLCGEGEPEIPVCVQLVAFKQMLGRLAVGQTSLTSVACTGWLEEVLQMYFEDDLKLRSLGCLAPSGDALKCYRSRNTCYPIIRAAWSATSEPPVTTSGKAPSLSTMQQPEAPAPPCAGPP